MLESFPSRGSSLFKESPVRGVPLLDGERCILRAHRNLIRQLGNTGVWPFLRCAPLGTTPRRTKRLASLIICFSQLGRFHRLSCHSRPDRRGHIRRITHRHWLLRPSQCRACYPALRLGRPRTAWPRLTAFPCSALDTGWIWVRSLHRQCPCARRAMLEGPNKTACLLA